MSDPTTAPQPPLEGLPPASTKRAKAVPDVPNAFFRYLGSAGASIKNRYGTWSLQRKDEPLHRDHPIKEINGRDVHWFSHEHVGLFEQLTPAEVTAFQTAKATAQEALEAAKKEK